MNIMSLPGFTAEASLYERLQYPKEQHRSEVATGYSRLSGVVPQFMRAVVDCDCFPCGDGGTCCVCIP